MPFWTNTSPSGTESGNLNQPSPDQYEQLQVQIDALKVRIAALEQGRPERLTEPVQGGPPPGQTGIGLTAVNRIGAVTLALGVLFFFKYAADNNWIGPAARVSLGLLAGIALVAFSEFLQRRNQRLLGQGITAAGLATIYISVFAAGGYYHLIGDAINAVLSFIVSAGMIYLAIRRKQATLAAFGFAAADLTILLWHRLLIVSGQSLITFAVTVAALFVARRQGWTILPPVASVLMLLTALLVQLPQADIALLFAVTGGFSWWASRQSNNNSALRSAFYICAHASAGIAALAVERALLSDTAVALTVASVLLGTYGLVLLWVGVGRSSTLNRSIGLTMLGLVIAKLYLYDIWSLNYGLRILAFVALGVLLLAASFVYSRWKAQ